MNNIPSKLELTDEKFRNTFNSVCLKAIELLNRNLHLNYTDHSIKHRVHQL
jgi:hypothetical protein